MAHPPISRTVYHIASINPPYICETFPLFKSFLAIRFVPHIYDFLCFPIQKTLCAVQLCTHSTPHHLQNCVPYCIHTPTLYLRNSRTFQIFPGHSVCTPYL